MNEDSVEKYGLSPAETMILEDYREKMPVFEKMRDFVCDLLKKKVAENNIYVTAVEARIKAEASLAEKLERKNGKYKSLTDLTDILGARVIAFYNDDVDKIAALVESLFEIDWKNSVDKRKMHELDSFGYNSLHFICTIPKTLFEDSECPELNEIRFEIQMRTALQHVWATLDHDTGYKSGFEIPHEYLRNLNRLAGMLELVDEQFCKIRTEINNYRFHVQSLVHSGRFDEVALNGDSFTNYLKLRPFDKLNQRIAAINQAEIHESSMMPFLKALKFLRFETLADVDKLIKEDSDDAYHLAAFQLANTDLDIINSSLGVISLLVVYILKKGGGVAGIRTILDDLYGESASHEAWANRLYKNALKLSFMNR
jgi:ppGpp synthetase/RelA/SpoT-type nucleotidyltranferase